MKVVIIKYNAGNIRSVDYALGRLGIEANITDDVDSIMAADKVIFPGVGEARSTMKYLRHSGLDLVIKDLKQPVLGICLGLQLMCRHSEEGDTDCLDIFPIHVRKFNPSNKVVKVPHMGWNIIKNLRSPLFQDIKEESFVYYVHSYYAELSEAATIATTPYIHDFSAALQKDNFFATQFHPEKSATVGSGIIENFINLKG